MQEKIMIESSVGSIYQETKQGGGAGDRGREGLDPSVWIRQEPEFPKEDDISGVKKRGK